MDPPARATLLRIAAAETPTGIRLQDGTKIDTAEFVTIILVDRAGPASVLARQRLRLARPAALFAAKLQSIMSEVEQRDGSS